MKMETTADFSAEITVNVKRVRKYDDVVRKHEKSNFQLVAIIAVFLTGAVALFWFQHSVLGSIMGIIALLFLWMRIRRGGYSGEFLQGVYTQGLLIPAIVRKTQPLTVLAMATLSTDSDAPQRYGCQEFVMTDLPAHKLQPGERVPCAAMFREGATSHYWGSFEVHPLCWATDNIEEIQENGERIDSLEWMALERLAKTLPDTDMDLLHILDEEYSTVASIKYYSQSSEAAVLDSSVYEQYPKEYGDIPPIDKNIPHAGLYATLLELAVDHKVYEYLFLLDSEGSPLYLTYINDPIAFLKKVDDLAVALTDGEAPLIADRLLVTNKGIWSKGEFTPWKDTQVTVETITGGLIRTNFNERKLTTSFRVESDYYAMDQEQITAENDTLRTLEIGRLSNFWKGVKETFS